MTTFIHRHFPKNKATWKRYFNVFLPIIFSATIIALNGMIDNFMVGHVEQGSTALGAVNSWTNIYTGLVLATSAAGSVALAQFYHAKDYMTVKQIARIRFMINISGALMLAIFAWTMPEKIIGVFMSYPEHKSGMTQVEWDQALINYNKAMDNALQYIRITAVQWIIYSVSYDLGSQLREVGHAKVTFYTSVLMLVYHISLNAALLYGAEIGIIGPAIAGATSRIIPVVLLTIYVVKKKVQVATNPLHIFKTSKKAMKLLLKRYIYFLSVFTVTFFITFRNHFWDIGYQVGSSGLGEGVSGLAVLALTGAIMNIFTTTFAAAPAMAANFVASELGKGNLEQAKINSDEIKGFNTIVASGLSLLLLAFSFVVPHMTFMVSAGEGGSTGSKLDTHAFLEQVSHSTMTIAFWYPIWIWFVTGYRNSQAGGKGGFMAIWDWIISGPAQLGWIAIIVYFIVPQSEYLQHHFWLSYFIFFISDLLKMIGMETYYYRYKWLNSLTKDQVLKEEVEEIAATPAAFEAEAYQKKR